MGAAAGAFTGTKPDAEAVRYRRLNDYRMEHIMLGGAEGAGSGASATGLPRWRQQVQYAVGHTLNDFYSLRPEVRRETPVQFLLERRWPPKGNAFASLLHYWEVKQAVADELMRIVADSFTAELPVMRFEQWHIPVRELEIELAVIFQLAWNSELAGRSLNIQKFMVHANPQVITGFLHMANVFCHKAYGQPAETIAIYSLLDGRRHLHDGAGMPLQKSLDYVRLLSVFLEREEHAEGCAECSRGRSDRDESLVRGYGLM
ncbi:hypothetical protein MHH28_10275 [Paenibacillus sp. FSL K6-1217]|uniref:hypothetical protein n=1 Tax=Paenibacillus sp. FSL K6-1217 TaxID=2921466 RepID=UPI0032482DFB